MPAACTRTCTQTCTHRTPLLTLKGLCMEEREKKNSEACPKGTVKADLVADFTRKFLEAINRKWLSKSRWSMLTAGTTQEIAERLNGCKKNTLLLSPWQSQYACSSFSPVLLHYPYLPKLRSLAVISQSANTFCLSKSALLEFWNECGRVRRFCLEGKRQEGLAYCAKDESEVPSSTQCLPGPPGQRS